MYIAIYICNSISQILQSNVKACHQCYQIPNKYSKKAVWNTHGRELQLRTHAEVLRIGKQARIQSLAQSATNDEKTNVNIDGFHGVPLLHGVADYDCIFDAPVDMMHIIENCFPEHMLKVLKGERHVSSVVYKPIEKLARESDLQFAARQRQAERKQQRMDDWCYEQNRKLKLWKLSKAKLKEAARRYRAIEAPRDARTNMCPFFNTATMKAADWVFFLKHASMWILIGLLPLDQLNAWQTLCALLRNLTQYRLLKSDVADLPRYVLGELGVLDKVLPECELANWYHRIAHIPKDIIAWGPSYVKWMFRTERNIGTQMSWTSTYSHKHT